MLKMLVGVSGWGGRNLIWNNTNVSAKPILTSLLYVPAPLHVFVHTSTGLQSLEFFFLSYHLLLSEICNQ